jgi:polyphosphate kinase
MSSAGSSPAVFIFHNNGREEIFLGSADWMNRNIYRRIEVCFPLYEEALKEEIRIIIRLQLEDSDATQEAIYRYLTNRRLIPTTSINE